MDKEERFRHAKNRIQVIHTDDGWFVVHCRYAKSAGPFASKKSAQAFKRRAVNEEMNAAES